MVYCGLERIQMTGIWFLAGCRRRPDMEDQYCAYRGL